VSVSGFLRDVEEIEAALCWPVSGDYVGESVGASRVVPGGDQGAYSRGVCDLVGVCGVCGGASCFGVGGRLVWLVGWWRDLPRVPRFGDEFG